MRYLSVCSGIEAASVAWHHLGWEPVGFSEIEPFPAAVLAHRFPNIPNYGDMTQHEQWPLRPGSIDLLVGGTPCQSFSVAGLRQGLADPRGNLMLTYLAIADRLRPKWIVWENVPGVLSSNGGRDFGTFLGALAQLGYFWAYRILDAQYVRVGGWPRAVPQRRRRVFVVGCLGDWAAAGEVLALAEGLQRHLEARRAKGKGTTADAEVGSGSSCCGTVSSKWAKGTGGPAGDAHLVGQPVPYDLFQITAPVNRQNRVPGDPCHTLAKDNAAHAAVAFANCTRDGIKVPEVMADGVTPALTNPGNGGRSDAINVAVAFQQNQLGEVRCNTVAGTVNTNSNPSGRNTPMVAIGTDCYNGAITGDVAATMGTPGSSVNASGPTVMQAVAFKTGNSAKARSNAESAEVTPTLGSDAGGNTIPAVAFTETSATIKGGSGARGYPDPSDGNGHSIVGNMMTVRRLTNRECERLQGFPDDWTLIPYRGKPAEQCPDGPRYRALGNSMACNVMAWIGERIAAYEAQNGST
jgi:DNA (cytosine-5)-methyltransferase 1